MPAEDNGHTHFARKVIVGYRRRLFEIGFSHRSPLSILRIREPEFNGDHACEVYFCFFIIFVFYYLNNFVFLYFF